MQRADKQHNKKDRDVDNSEDDTGRAVHGIGQAEQAKEPTKIKSADQ